MVLDDKFEKPHKKVKGRSKFESHFDLKTAELSNRIREIRPSRTSVMS